MNDHREISLTRDCDAIQIPSGHPIVLPEGMDVIITQSLGGAYTVATPGGLARIELKDGDALGFDPLAPAESPRKHEGPAEEAVWLQLKTVFDPEIPVNVVDLGLIYDCRVDATESGSFGPRAHDAYRTRLRNGSSNRCGRQAKDSSN